MLPPGSTLFPYTTLFRSTAVAQVKGVSPLPTQQQLGLLGLERAWWSQAVLNPSRDKVQYVVVDENTIDRKSTRLKSSHTVISYAVFCLKKKTTRTINRQE